MYAIYAENRNDWLWDPFNFQVGIIPSQGELKRLLYSPITSSGDITVSSATLSFGKNMSGDLTMTIPASNPNRSYLDTMSSTVVVERQGKEIWRGRPINRSFDMYQNLSVTCEGELSYLNDILIPAYNYSWNGNGEEGEKHGTIDDDNRITVEEYLKNMLNGYNNLASLTRKIKIGHIDGKIGEQKVNCKLTQMDSVLNQIMTNVVDVFGGWLEVSHWRETDSGEWVFDDEVGYLNYYNESIYANDQPIRIAYNILNYNIDSDMSEIATVLYPFGDKEVETTETVTIIDEEGNKRYEEQVTKVKVDVDISEVNTQHPGLKYVDVGEELLNRYGVIQKAIYCDFHTPQEVYTYALSQIKEILKITRTATVSVFDMSVIDNHFDPFLIGQEVEVTLTKSTSTYTVDSISLDILNPESSTITITQS